MKDKQDQNTDANVPVWPVFTEKHWYTFSISLILIGLGLAVFAVDWVLSAETLESSKLRIEVLTPFATMFLAVVTFCTVAWRGMVNSRQADQQMRQNDSKDEENLAKLLVDGTKMVSEDRTNKAQVHAGIAALQVVITAPLDRFSVHAMDILIDIITETYKEREQEFIFNAARQALDSGARAGRRSTRSISVTSTDEEDLGWYAINGARRVRYEGGTFEQGQYALFLNYQSLSFSNVLFDACQIHGEPVYMKQCSFAACSFGQISSGMLMRCTFSACDMSGTKFYFPTRAQSRAHELLSAIAGMGNFYYEDMPPSGPPDIDFSDYFLVKKRENAGMNLESV